MLDWFVIAEAATSIDISALTNALKSAVTVEQVLTLLAGVVTAGIAYVLVYAFGRKAIKGFISAVTRGTLRV